ncbi:MAG: hypothetical protein WAP57_00855, partial [Aquabacterium commune]|uniref:hypothetical protein n=1 Tax=Aquabacterium commune TaxID=70586 RepID=UPI003BAE93DC
LRALHANVVMEVAKAEVISADDVDAMDWLEVQKRYLAKLEELISLLQSDSVPDGSVIRTAQGENPTHVHRALRGLATKALELGAGSKAAMEQLLNSLEAGLAKSGGLPLLGASEGAN